MKKKSSNVKKRNLKKDYLLDQTFTKKIAHDPRMGNTHLKVPGNDGQRGYAGSCFPKDTNALAWFAREILNTPFTQLETSIKINETLRKNNQS